MKNVIYIMTLLVLLGCDNTVKRDSTSASDRLELVPEPDKDLREAYEKKMKETSQLTPSTNCAVKAIDFVKLKDKALQTSFFFKLDSIRKVQYPNNDQEHSIMVDITPDYLHTFLNDLSQDSLIMMKRFKKAYHFNIAPKNYKDPEVCADHIEITFDDTHCTFRLAVYNTFLVESDWCTESMVVYGFKITTTGIIDFWRNEAG